MAQMMFVNLPVTDLPRATAFYEAIGATQNPMFSDETAACMVLSETLNVMLLTHDKFRRFTPKPVADAHAASEVLLCLSAESREAVDDVTEKALAAGGREVRPAEDHGFMYGRAFEDPDGHIWEPMWMDLEGFKAAMAGKEQLETA
ncbi:MAG TPA: VOC family protein [Allosphingosinicella sp.]